MALRALYGYGGGRLWRYRYAVTVLVCTGLGLGWFFGVYGPLDKAVQACGRRCVQLDKQAHEIKKVQLLCGDLEQCVAQGQQYCQNLLACCTPSSQELFLQTVDQLQKSGLQLRDFTIGRSIDKQWYMRDNVQLQASGSLQQVANFLHAIKTAAKMIRCTDVTLSRTEDSTYLLTCSLDVTLPKRAQDNEISVVQHS